MPATSQLLEGRKALCGADACKALSKIHLGPLALPLSEEGHPTGPRLGGDLATRGREEASHIPGHGRRNRGPPACRPPCRRCGSPQKPAQGFGVRGRDCVGARGRHLRGEDGVMLRGPSQLTCGGRLFWLVQLSRFCRINGFKILSSGLGLSSVAFRKCVSIRECGQIPPGRERPLTPGEACEGPSTDARWVPVPGGRGGEQGAALAPAKAPAAQGRGRRGGSPSGRPAPQAPGRWLRVLVKLLRVSIPRWGAAVGRIVSLRLRCRGDRVWSQAF